VLRVGSVLFWTLLAGGIVWLAAARWNGVPADPSGGVVAGSPGSLPIDPALDRTTELVEALNALPPEPPFTLPPAPEGMRWKPIVYPSIQVTDALNGPWTPETRPHLQAVIDYVESPAVEAALARIAAIEPGGWRPFGPTGVGIGPATTLRRAAKLLVARARYYHAGRGDLDAAIAELDAAYRLARLTSDSGVRIGLLVAMANEAFADMEVVQLTREHDLDPAQAAKIVAAIQGNTSDLRETWRHVVREDTDRLCRIVDLCWTKDDDGDGWLVLSHLDELMGPTWAAERRCGAWNVLSPLFNSRITVQGKIDRLRQADEHIAEMPYPEAIQAFEAGEGKRNPYNPANGPQWWNITSGRPSLYSLLVRTAVHRSAALTAIGLSAYRHDHGQYPQHLQDALEPYLGDVPLDPHDKEPLRYKRAGGDYILYSIWSNCVDEGGVEPTSRRGFERDAADLVLTRARGEPGYEPVLETSKP